MSYEYIKKFYGIAPAIGARVQHDVTKKFGTIKRERRSASHYVMVQFDGSRHSLPCHPMELGLPVLESKPV